MAKSKGLTQLQRLADLETMVGELHKRLIDLENTQRCTLRHDDDARTLHEQATREGGRSFIDVMLGRKKNAVQK